MANGTEFDPPPPRSQAGSTGVGTILKADPSQDDLHWIQKVLKNGRQASLRILEMAV